MQKVVPGQGRAVSTQAQTPDVSPWLSGGKQAEAALGEFSDPTAISSWPVPFLAG